ncbi:MAG: PQQ-dependent sugar dehydrogenase [Pirellulales bacterium]
MTISVRFTRFSSLFLLLFGASVTQILGQDASVDRNKTARQLELREFAMNHPGNIAEGKKLFEDQRVGCNKCHGIDGTSRSVGPNLNAIGNKFERRDLITSIIEPSRTIAIGFGTTSVVTVDGQVLSGILQRVTNTNIELLDKENKTIRLALNDIETQKESNVSIMPDGLEQNLTNQEFADLIAYLESLKSSPNTILTDEVTTQVPRASNEATLRNFFEGVRFDHPTWFGEIPSKSAIKSNTDKRSYLVLEQSGQAFVVQQELNESNKRTLFDLSPSVRSGGATGLLGAAFHPKFATNGRYYVKYQTLDGQRIQSVVEERTMLDGLSDSGRTRELLRIDAVTQDHNGGCIEFGPDGFLYIGMGDSGPQHDPQGHGQDLGTLLGKILRIDVDASASNRPYVIPKDNPFCHNPKAKPEVWAFGFREPWRFSFDPDNGDLWVGDVGQDRIEEVAIVRQGENHGWNVYEGHTEHARELRNPQAQYVKPVFSYSRSLGVSITGGYVLRGPNTGTLSGWYVCGDFESRRIWALQQSDRKLAKIVEIGRAPSRIVSFGVDSLRNIYLLGYDDGIIYQMDFSKVDVSPRTVRMLADTSQQSGVLWRYTTTKPPDNWMDANFDDSQWMLGPGGFGTQGTPGAVVRTDWNSRDIWIRRSFALDENPPSITNLMLSIHHDEDVAVFLNGVEALRRGGWTSGYNEFGFRAESARTLRAGRNVIAVHCHQNNGGQYIDVGIIEHRQSSTVTPRPAAR